MLTHLCTCRIFNSQLIPKYIALEVAPWTQRRCIWGIIKQKWGRKLVSDGALGAGKYKIKCKHRDNSKHLLNIGFSICDSLSSTASSLPLCSPCSSDWTYARYCIQKVPTSPSRSVLATEHSSGKMVSLLRQPVLASQWSVICCVRYAYPRSTCLVLRWGNMASPRRIPKVAQT